VRSRADGRLIAGALAAGVCFDIAAQQGIATIASTLTVLVTAAALLLGGRVRGVAGTGLIALAAVFGLVFAFRSSPWVVVPAALAVVGCLLLGVSLGADDGGLAVSFPVLAARVGVVVAHLVNAPGMFCFKGESAPGAVARKKVSGVLLGIAIAVPLMLVIGVLLASADPIFRSWFDPSLVAENLALFVIGGWLLVGLARAASAERPQPAIAEAPSLSTVTVVIVLGGLCALYAAFVAAQFVALSGAGQRILTTQGLTYAEYARSGFFRLLACAAITLILLPAARACADPASPVVNGLAALTSILTLGVVVVAVRRLQLYEAAFGLTALRLACLAVAIWIGVLFLGLAVAILVRWIPGQYFSAFLLVSGLVLVAAWSAAAPAVIVAQTNLHRAERGRSLDISQLTSLGPDAVPSVIAGLPRLPRRERVLLRQAICGTTTARNDGASFNVAVFSAATALSHDCAR
jgi:hypothetical protein